MLHLYGMILVFLNSGSLWLIVNSGDTFVAREFFVFVVTTNFFGKARCSIFLSFVP